MRYLCVPGHGSGPKTWLCTENWHHCWSWHSASSFRWAVADVHSVLSWEALSGLGQRLVLGTRRP